MSCWLLALGNPLMISLTTWIIDKILVDIVSLYIELIISWLSFDSLVEFVEQVFGRKTGGRRSDRLVGADSWVVTLSHFGTNAPKIFRFQTYGPKWTRCGRPHRRNHLHPRRSWQRRSGIRTIIISLQSVSNPVDLCGQGEEAQRRERNVNSEGKVEVVFTDRKRNVSVRNDQDGVMG